MKQCETIQLKMSYSYFTKQCWSKETYH